MTTNSHIRGRRLPWKRAALGLACAGLLVLVPTIAASSPRPAGGQDEELEGRIQGPPAVKNDSLTIEAAFQHESYAPGDKATLRLYRSVRGLEAQLFRSGPEGIRTHANNVMNGVPASALRSIGPRRAGDVVSFRLGSWPSGLYFAKLNAPGGRVGYAPFVLRPRRLGEHAVAVVLPTRTWQAYNLRDDDGDGRGDSWYAGWNGHTARLDRPYLDRGVPFRFRVYDLPFLRWLAQTHRSVDILSDADLGATRSADELRRAYQLIVFPGHHEYVTTREYDLVQGFRDRGGNLMFLSANNFFWQVVITDRVMNRTRRWRDLGRPEAALIGVQYIGNDEGEHRSSWLVRNVPSMRWLWNGSDIRPGMPFSDGGIEIDHTAAASPRNVSVLAEMPNLLGPGQTAQMAYYETPAGAHVFAAGAFTLGGAIFQPPVRRMVANLWARLAKTGTVTPGTAERKLSSVSRRPPGASYGWPLKPFFQQHPVRAFFGDPRVGRTPNGVSRQFHFGIDISAADGTPVYATLTGTASVHPLHPDVVLVRGSAGVEFSYWHVVPAVRSDERVVAYKTLIGHIERPWGHVHFSESRNGRYVDPLRPGALGPYTDETKPSIDAFELERDGQPVSKAAVNGKVDLVVETRDPAPKLVPAPWNDMPVMPVLVRWRLLGPSGAIRGWQTAIDFRETIPSASAFDSVFARWTRQNHPHQPGRYRVFLAHGFDTRSLGPGGYQVEVEADDESGNETTTRFPFEIR